MFNLIFSKRFYFLRTETDRLLVPSMIFSVLLVFASLGHSGYPGSLFLVWNLFLGYIPYAISNAAVYRPQWVESGWKFTLVFVAWLFFIPNSFYLLTDLFHLGEVKSIPGMVSPCNAYFVCLEWIIAGSCFRMANGTTAASKMGQLQSLVLYLSNNVAQCTGYIYRPLPPFQ